MKIEITVPRYAWWQRTRKYSRTIAESWSDLPIAVRLTFLRIMLSEHELIVAKIKILGLILKLPRRVFARMDSDSLMSLIDKLEWLNLEPSATILPHFRWYGEIWHLPNAGFYNGTAIEFAIADDYATKFATTNDEKYLRLLAATVAHPLDDNDVRQPLTSREEAEKRADKEFAKLPIEICISVLLYFTGVKVKISEWYGEFLFDEVEQKFSIATAHFPNFGWWSAYLQIAESHVFGNYEQVLQTNFHRICMYLIEKRKAALQMEAAYKDQNKDVH